MSRTVSSHPLKLSGLKVPIFFKSRGPARFASTNSRMRDRVGEGHVIAVLGPVLFFGAGQPIGQISHIFPLNVHPTPSIIFRNTKATHLHHLTAAFRALSGFPGMSNVAKTGAEEATAAWMSSGCFNLDLGPKVTFQMVGTGAMRFFSQQPVAVLTGDFRTPAIFSVLSYTLNTPAAGNGQSADL